MNRVAVAAAKLISAGQAAGFVESGMWLDYGTSLCQPDVFDRALASRITELTNRDLEDDLRHHGMTSSAYPASKWLPICPIGPVGGAS